MKKCLFVIGLLLSIFTFNSCKDSETFKKATLENEVSNNTNTENNIVSVAEQKKNPNDFIPDKFVAFDTIIGDLNKDGQEDYVLIIKGTEKSRFVDHESRGKLDRNRRGIIVLLKKNENYEMLVKNDTCFSSENEDGGVYFAPEMDVTIEKGKLFINYSHGRYGYWSYTFRLKNNDLELIGFDSAGHRGPVVESLTSINFLTRKKVEKINTNQDEEEGDEVFEETISKVKLKEMIKLSAIKDFEELDSSEW